MSAIIAGRREDCVLEYPVRTAGAEVWLNIRATRFQGPGPLRLVIAHEDISERTHLEQHLESLVRARTAELEEAKNAAKAASRAKSAFLANMSHEIRTPMNAILGLTHLLRNRSQDPTQQRQLDKVANAGRHLLELINSILDIAKIESGKLTLEHRDFALDEILDGVVNLVQGHAREKALELRLERDPFVPTSLHGDALRLKQVLLNLTTNAVKFTDHGQVTIGVRHLDGPNGAPWLHFQVEDTGIGLTDEQRARLFQPFEQADNSTTRRYGGTGLGLAISRHLIALMGGRIGVESRLSAGSRFWFELPLIPAIGEHPESIPGSEAVPSPPTADGRLPLEHQGRRLLLVEDNAINQEVALALLRDMGLNVEVADNGQVAVEMACRTAYDLILMDIQMPVMNGLEAAQAIHTLPGRRELPILAMTANAFEADRQDSLRAGLCDHIAKPVDPEALYAKLQRWLPGPSVATAMPTSESAEAEVDDRIARLRTVTGLDVDAGLRHVCGQAATYVRLLQRFVIRATQMTERASECLADGDRVELQRAAHELKGMAATLGVESVREGAQSLEEALRAESPTESVQAQMEHLEGVQQAFIQAIESILK